MRKAQPFLVGDGGNFTGSDFAAATPEHIRITCGDSDIGQVLVDGGFVRKDGLAVGAVGDAHDVDAVELRAALAPVAMGHDVETADLAAGIVLAAFGDGPVEEGVVLRDTLAGSVGFDVLEKG